MSERIVQLNEEVIKGQLMALACPHCCVPFAAVQTDPAASPNAPLPFRRGIDYFPAIFFLRSNDVKKEHPLGCSFFQRNQPNSAIRTPAAIAEPITPATFGPMACMSRKLEGFSF